MGWEGFREEGGGGVGMGGEEGTGRPLACRRAGGRSGDRPSCRHSIYEVLRSDQKGSRCSLFRRLQAQNSLPDVSPRANSIIQPYAATLSSYIVVLLMFARQGCGIGQVGLRR
jgi:hypothetical protein